MNKITIFITAVFVLAVVGFFVATRNPGDQSQPPVETSPATQESANEVTESQVLAGTISQYKTFSKAEYDRAIADGKVVFLNFYANWCPICRAEAPDIVAGFNSLNNPNVVGFRVDYKDDKTDDDEKALAAQFQITYQHSKVIVRGQETIYKQIAEKWDEEKLIAELGNI